ncbi:DUF1660 family phage protein [Lactococcus lactis]
MKILCKLFGHEWSEWKRYVPNGYEVRFCHRCEERERRVPGRRAKR